MTFVFPVLLGGMVLAGVPILLHLIMRQKPKVLPFPAFRFLLQRHRKNLRKLQLRHLLLLTLRILLLAAICLALARPQVFHARLGLSSDRPVAAILLFDTSPSMAYQTSDGPSRLSEAQRRGLELVNELPDGSRVAILDTAEAIQSGKGEWLLAPSQARDRIGKLKVRPANAPVTTRLEDAYRLFAELAGTKGDEPGRTMPRFLCVLSDRTRACWDAGRLPRLQELNDQVAPAVEGLQQAREDIPPLAVLLKDLRQRLPPPTGQDYPEQALLVALDSLRERLPSVTNDELPPNLELANQLQAVRTPLRQLLRRLQDRKDPIPDDAKEYRGNLLAALAKVFLDLNGVPAVFVDVGVDNPVDLAIVDLELPRQINGQPRQVFAANERIILRALVQATGKDVDNEVTCRIGKETYRQSIAVKAGQRQPVMFEIDPAKLKLDHGTHQVEVHLGRERTFKDQLNFDNARYVTFGLRQPRNILVLADEPARADRFQGALQSLAKSGWALNGEVRAVSEFSKLDLNRYQAIYLFAVKAPDAALWGRLADYVARGGSLGIVPGGDEMNLSTYDTTAAQKLMPGRWKGAVTVKELPDKKSGATWNLRQPAIFQHPLLRPFRDWKDDLRIDFIDRPAEASRFWEVEPRKDALVLVHYDAKNLPALLERQFESEKGRKGKVLLFTTPLDSRQPRWNDYLESLSSFYLVLTGLATNYLAGDTEAANLNFIAGEAEPVVMLAAVNRAPLYTLRGPELLDSISVADRQTELVLKQATVPGNYTLESGDAKATFRFSVNVPPSECDLTRVPPVEIETVLGKDSLVPVDRRGKLREALGGYWSAPRDFFPELMILLLLILASESLLANLFYRKEPEAQ